MTTALQPNTVIEDLVTKLEGAPPAELRVERQPLRGGLDSSGVDRLTLRYRDSRGRARSRRIVAKRLAGHGVREAAVYERIVGADAGASSPRLLAVERPEPDQVVLYLESVRPVSSWPWRERRAAQSVLQQAARLHAREPRDDEVGALAGWDYESELRNTATRTLELLEQTRVQAGLWSFGGAARWTRRVVRALPAMRRHLLAHAPFGRRVIHGDLHPGNVVLRRRRGRREPALLDWGRARIGSPLEDVSCWLQSLGTWEPEARRRHDTLFVGYLAARGLEPRLDSELRAAYWMAGASNALSGALLYHLSVLLDERLSSSARQSAAYSAREWVRVLRRADAHWS